MIPPPATATDGGESRASRVTGRAAAASKAALRAAATRTARSPTDGPASRSDRRMTGPSSVDTSAWSVVDETGAAKKRGTKVDVDGRTSVNWTEPEEVPLWALTTTGTSVWVPVDGAAGATALSSLAEAASTRA